MENLLVCGTPGYIAPEGISGKGISTKTDIFSVGAILFNMLTLKPLFSGDEYLELMLQNKRCQWDNIDHRLRHCSLKARDLVTWLLTKDPSRRPTAKQALQHRWFKNHRVGITTSLNLNRVLASKRNPTLQEIQEVLNSPEPAEQIEPFKKAEEVPQKRKTVHPSGVSLLLGGQDQNYLTINHHSTLKKLSESSGDDKCPMDQIDQRAYTDI